MLPPNYCPKGPLPTVTTAQCPPGPLLYTGLYDTTTQLLTTRTTTIQNNCPQDHWPNRTTSNHDNTNTLIHWVVGHYRPTISHKDHYQPAQLPTRTTTLDWVLGQFSTMIYSPLDSATTQLLPTRTNNQDNYQFLTRTTTLDWVLRQLSTIDGQITTG